MHSIHHTQCFLRLRAQSAILPSGHSAQERRWHQADLPVAPEQVPTMLASNSKSMPFYYQSQMETPLPAMDPASPDVVIRKTMRIGSEKILTKFIDYGLVGARKFYNKQTL